MGDYSQTEEALSLGGGWEWAASSLCSSQDLVTLTAAGQVQQSPLCHEVPSTPAS